MIVFWFLLLATYLSVGIGCCAYFAEEFEEDIAHGYRKEIDWLWFIPLQLLIGPILVTLGLATEIIKRVLKWLSLCF